MHTDTGDDQLSTRSAVSRFIDNGIGGEAVGEGLLEPVIIAGDKVRPKTTALCQAEQLGFTLIPLEREVS